MQQTTSTVLMIRPSNFRRNEQTAINNYYQQKTDELPNFINQKAQNEFDIFVEKIQENLINVIVIQDTEIPDTPDAIFPNNWISFHENGNVAIYPMFAENRRLERREDILEVIEKNDFIIKNGFDYTQAEDENIFLEGTGSMVLDRINRKAYCAISQRSDEELFIEFCEDFEFFPVVFTANHTVDNQRKPIYHTNVMMSIAETFAIICLDAIDDKKEKKDVLKHLKTSGKEVVTISEAQVNQFAGNTLQLKNQNNELFLIMSSSAYNSLTAQQIEKIEKHCKIIHSDLSTIEANGGGSARCMIAEVFLPRQS